MCWGRKAILWWSAAEEEEEQYAGTENQVSATGTDAAARWELPSTCSEN